MRTVSAKVWSRIYREMFGETDEPPHDKGLRREYYGRVIRGLQEVYDEAPEECRREIIWANKLKEDL